MAWRPNNAQCKHCQTRRADRPRGLCAICYYDVNIREMYFGQKRGRHPNFWLHLNSSKPVDQPTQALPGTSEKFAELERRAALGMDLWHPQDAVVILE